ncbi:MAG: NADH-quinone oxidoreductase subunit M [Chloroflexota bacterium]|nr:MAG: NADH-quinone oxidoreductase subunit M [Chloroflexota bacterium]
MLTATIFLPALGALIVSLLPRDNARLIRQVAVAFTSLAFIVSLALWFGFDRHHVGIQFGERMPWIPSLGIQYFVGIDGLSLPMVVLTTLLTMLAVIASLHIDLRPKEYFALLLILETGVLGVFSSLDMFLFFLFWEVELIPMYLLIGIWGGARREYAAIKFVIYTLAGSALMLVGILALYFNSPAPHTFDMIALGAMTWSPVFQAAVFLFLFFGFAVKLPMVPFHTWLPDAHVEAPTAVSVLLAGVLLKMGGYGILRLCISILPDAAREYAPWIGVFAVINVLYGALVVLAQRDLKAIVAYSSVSQMGYVLLGYAGLNMISLTGASIQLFSHGLISGLLFFLVGSIYEKTHTRQVAEMRGLAPRMPILAAVFSIAGLATLGLPGMSGFVAEFVTFTGAFRVQPVLTILCVFGIVLSAGYMLWTIRRVFFGPLDGKYLTLGDARGAELVPLFALVGLIILFGSVPSLLVDVIEPGTTALAARLGGS